MSYFLAFDVPEYVKDFACDMIEKYRPLSPKSEWILDRDKLHVTYQFLGDSPDYKLEESSPSGAFLVEDNFYAQVNGFGQFGKRVFFLNVSPSRDLVWRNSKRDVKYHLTLAKGGVKDFETDPQDSGFLFQFPVPELVLYKTQGGGKPYLVQERIELK